MNAPHEQKDLGLLLGAGAAQPALSAYLDGLSQTERIAEVRRLSARQQAALFERCAGAPPFTLTDLVPAEVAVGKTVIMAGRNSLPLFRLFEKRFTRLPSGDIAGFNFQTMSPVTGPGYFKVVQSGAEILIDYTQIPEPSEVPPGWPAVRGNASGLSVLIYNKLHDYCRRVSQDVLIGRATRLGKPMNNYFVLARGDVI